MHESAPYHVVRIDTHPAQGAGQFYKLGIAAGTLDFMRAWCEGQWVILSDQGIVDDSTIEREPCALTEALEAKKPFKLHVLKKAA